MQLHSNAATCPRQRDQIRRSSLPYRVLSAQLSISVSTVHHWKHAPDPNDRSTRAHTISHALSAPEEAMVLWMRQLGEFSLDDLLDAVLPVLPQARRSSLHRLLQRHGCSRLPKREQQLSGHPGVFKEYDPGFLHIDCFYLPKLDGQKYYCFVAIDRATRFVFLDVYENKNKEAATDFLNKCLQLYPFKINTILTDNGREFTLSTFKNRWGSGTKTTHPFEQLCLQQGIEHRKTKPYTPKTNGMVERANGLIKEGTTKQHHYKNAQQMKGDLRRWFIYYNFYRRHRTINNIPYEAVEKWFTKKPKLFHKKPETLLQYRSQSHGT
ncbi:MAG: DDE-type integrase/transposase/recombinase [Abditibacteriaceae bacterium]